ncbi:MAG: erythromycin esterase family protein [Thermoanaerobaculia bacterium]|nr:erythromycin esterase family protein [Thermoanaerobaculia bacterium]
MRMLKCPAPCAEKVVWFLGCWLCALAFSACAAEGPVPSRGTPEPEASEIRTAGQPRSISLQGDDDSDLQFLVPLLQGKRIVQLGENTHGIHEYNLIKSRIVRFLHERLGFNVLAFESSPYQCYLADLRASNLSARSMLSSSVFGVWHTEALVPLFETLQDSHRSDRVFHLAGFDVQPIGPNKAGRPKFLAQQVRDASYAEEVLALDAQFLDVYSRSGSARRSFFRSEEGQEMAYSYDRLAEHLSSLSEAAEPEAQRDRSIARKTARSMAWYIRQQSAPTTADYVERRDEGMAENLIQLVEELYPGEKVVVWGHNFHLRYDNLAIQPVQSMFPDEAARTMGSWIHDRYGSEVYTVGLYAYQGQAADNRGQVFEISPAAEGSLEERLFDPAVDAAFLDISQTVPDGIEAWVQEPVRARYDGRVELEMVPADQYDAILVVGHATPRTPLE